MIQIIPNSTEYRLFDLANSHDDLYFADLNALAHRYRSSIVIIDLTNAMRNGKACTRWLFSAQPWHMSANRLCVTEYLEMAAPECDTLPQLLDWLRSGKPLTEVDGLTVEVSAQPGNRTYSPFAPVKAVKLGDRLTAATVAKAILSGQIAAGRTDGRYTDDYAMDAACDFYAGNLDLTHFAAEIYEHPSGWRFWWRTTDRTEIVAACHTFDYKTLIVA